MSDRPTPKPLENDCPSCAELHEKLEAAREALKRLKRLICPHHSDVDHVCNDIQVCHEIKAALQKLGVEG